jgi:probable HAF family extracellular repeat protein
MKENNMNTTLRLLIITLTALAASKTWLVAQEHNTKHHHYQLIDVGTLGGPLTGLSYPLPGEVQLNRRGLVVGISETANPDPNTPNCITPDCDVAHAFQWQNGVLTDLGVLPGGDDSYAFSSNDRGEVVGMSENGLIDPFTGFPETVGVLWTRGKVINLGTLGGNASWAGAINDRGQVVGAALNDIPDSFSGSLAIGPFFPLTTQLHGFLWEHGVMKDLGTLGGPDSQAQYINARGQIAGQSFTDFTPNPPVTAPACITAGIPTQHPFLWQNGFTDLGSLGGTCGYANWLNNRGQVIGTMTLAGDSTNHAFLWDRGVLTDLGTLGGNNSEAWFANNAGEVVGRADFSPSSTDHHAFLWRRGARMIDLGTVAGQPLSTAEGINSHTQIVGDSLGNGWLWENGSIVDLNTLVPSNSTVHVAGAVAINDRGEIVAEGFPSNGDDHVVVLIPCDDDHPDVDGCDYSLAEVDSATRAGSASASHNSPTANTNDRINGHAESPQRRRFTRRPLS